MNFSKKLVISILFLAVFLFSLVFTSAYVQSYYSSQYNNAMGLGIFSNSQSLRINDEMCTQGTDFIMQIAPLSCTPAVVRSDLLEEENVRVFCQLNALQINPFVDVKAIDWITFSGQHPKEVLNLGYQPAQAALGSSYNVQKLENPATLQNLGYVMITLRQQPNESALKNCKKAAGGLGGEVCWVEGNLTAELTYDVENSYGIGKAVFYLPVFEDDEEWQDNYKHYSFWQGRGYLRAESVDGDDKTATISIYSDSEVASGLSKRDREFSLAKYASNIKLKEGESTADKIYLPGISPCLSSLKLTLNGVEDPQTRASLKVNEDYSEVAEDEMFYDNKCKVIDMNKNGVNSDVTIRCSGADEASERKAFTLRVFPQINLTINGKEGVYNVGDWLYKTADGTKSVYLGYVGTEDDSTDFNKLYAYLVALPVHKEVLTDDELESVASHANTVKHVSSSGASALDATSKFANYIAGKTMQFGKWVIKGESFYDLYYNQKEENVEGNFVILGGFANAENLEIKDEEFNTYYQNAMDDFETVINRFSGELEKENSEETLGQKALYEEIYLASWAGQRKSMLELCKKYEESYPFSYRSLYMCADELHLSNSQISSKDITINGITKVISLEEIKEPSLRDYSAKILVTGPNGKTEVFDLMKDKQIILKGFREKEAETPEFIMLQSIDGDSVELKLNLGDRSTLSKAFETNSYTLKKGMSETHGGYSFTITETHLNKIAKVSVTPEIKFAKSNSTFSYKIGIEKRVSPFKFSPEMTKDRINQLNKSIENWQKASDALYSVVKTMKSACMGAGAVLTFKNLIANVGGKSIARQEVMNGAGGWNERCNEMYSEKQYKSMDACFLDNADAIESDVNSYYSLMKYQDEEIKKFENANMNDEKGIAQNYVNQKGFVDDYSESVRTTLNSLTDDQKKELQIENLNKILTTDGWENNKYTIEQLREIELYALALKNSPTNEVVQTRLTSSLADVANNAKEFVVQNTFEQRTGMGDNTLVGSFDKIVKMQEIQVTNPVQLKSTHYANVNIEKFDETPISPENYAFALKTSNSAKEYLVIYDNPKDGVVLQTYEIVINNGVEELKIVDKEKGKQNPFDLHFKLYNELSYKNTYKSSYGNKDILLKYYETSPYKGLPAVVPFDVKDGWYAGIKHPETSYDLSGRVTSFWVCNVGANGIEEFSLQDFGDDICQLFNLNTGQKYTNFPGLKEDESYQLVVKADNAIQAAQNARASQENVNYVKINGRKMKVGEPAVQNPATQCTDFMSAKDCATLFNLCDPVICPSSRCDLGGKYPVQNVIQSGIIGSIALCYPNAKWAGGDVYVPFCLSGIYTGIDSWLSIQKSYKDCLQRSIETGETIGICDEINSIYTCEFFWKQSLPIIKTALPKLLGVITGENKKGGGEYQAISSAFETAQNSIDYFKQYYAEDSYRAFKVRSTEEVGSELCGTFVSASYPGSGSFLDNLVEPDSPVQFTAKFDENQLTTVTNPPTSHYKVYFHIYAGKDTGAYYKVYLRGSGSSYYLDTVQNRIVASGYIAKGGYTSNTTDFTAPSGYSELCVEVNGQLECGFKEVSTSFGLNYLDDLYLTQQASQTDIKTEKECISGSASLYSLLNLNLESAANNLIDPQIYAQGITRICATDDPGQGTDINAGLENAKWKRVGSCGNDNIGCWIDTDSVKSVIKAMNLEQKALDEVGQESFQYLSEDYLSEEAFNLKLEEINAEGSPLKKIELINAIIEKVFFSNQKGQLFFLRGKSYSDMALTKVKVEFPCRDFCGIDANDPYVSNTYFGMQDPETGVCEKGPIVRKKCEKGCDVDLGICMEDITLNINNEDVPIGKNAEIIKPEFDKEFNDNYNSPKLFFNDKNIFSLNDRCFRFKDGKWQFANGCQKAEGAWYNVEELGKGYTNPVTEENYLKIIKYLQNKNGDYIGGMQVLIDELQKDDSAELSDKTNELTLMDNTGLFTVEFSDHSEKSMRTIYYKYNQEYSRWEWKLKDKYSTDWNSVYGENKEFNQDQIEVAKLLELTDLYQGAAILFDYKSAYFKKVYDEGKLNTLEKSFEERNTYRLADLMKSLSTSVFNSNYKCYCGTKCEDYARWITDASTNNDIPDQLLLLAIMMHESNCKSVESAGGDIGLMQVNAKVHCGKGSLALGLPIDLTKCKGVLLEDEQQNINVGAKILKQNYKPSSGTRNFMCNGLIIGSYSGWEAALRGYNGWGCTGDNNYVENVEKIYYELVDLYNGKSLSAPATSSSQQKVEVFFTTRLFDFSGDRLYYKYNNGWKWSPDKTNWMDSSQTEVTTGEYKGESPRSDNLEIINSINGKSYSEGKSILKINGAMMEDGSEIILESSPVTQTTTTTPLSSQQKTEIFVIKRNIFVRLTGGSNIYFKYDSGWKWTPYSDYSTWMPSSTTTVASGKYSGKTPSSSISEVISLINGKSYSEGKKILNNNDAEMEDGSKIVLESVTTTSSSSTTSTNTGTSSSSTSTSSSSSSTTSSSTSTSTTQTPISTIISSDCDYEKINPPCTNYDKDVLLSMFTTAERNIFLYVKSCSECGTGLLNFCDREECKAIEMKLKKDCVYTEQAFIGSCDEKIISTTTTNKLSTDSSDPSAATSVFVFKFLDKYTIYYKYLKQNNGWYWSIGGTAYNPVGPIDSGLMEEYNKNSDIVKSINENNYLILALKDKNYEEGKKILKDKGAVMKDGNPIILSSTLTCTTNQEKCDGTTYYQCTNNAWVNKGKVNGKCGYVTPLVPITPPSTSTLTCTTNQEKCDGTNYYTCSGTSWLNKGQIDGKCGYVFGTCTSGENKCVGTLTLNCVNNKWISGGVINNKCDYLSSQSTRNRILNAAEELKGTPFVKYDTLTSSQRAEIDKSSSIWVWKGIPVVRDYDSGTSYPNCFDSTQHLYLSANVAWGSFTYCLKDGIVKRDTDLCSKNTDINKDTIEEGDILSITWPGNEIHSVVFLNWVDKTSGKAEVFDWIGFGDANLFPSAFENLRVNRRVFREVQLNLKFDESPTADYVVYAIGKPATA